MSRVRLFWFFGLALVVASCGTDPGTTEEDLTSKAGVERELAIKAYVYVDQNAPSYTVESAAAQQIRTAFGPLRIGQLSVDDRELRSGVDKASFQKSTVEVVKKDAAGAVTVVKKVDKITYTYKARALVANSLSSQTSFSLALLMGYYQSFASEILQDCTADPTHDADFVSSFWYVWAPDEYKCQERINKELAEIETERQGLGSGQIGEKEYGRRYLPVKAELKAAAAPATTYPEYDQLYGITSNKDRIVVYQVLGVAAHGTDPIDQQFENDMGFIEYFKVYKVLADKFTGLKIAADSAVSPLSFQYNSKAYTGTFQQLYSWVVDQTGFPSDIKSADRKAFRRAIHDNIKMKWVKLEIPLDVTSARGTKKMTLEIRLIFGTEGDYSTRTIFKEAFKSADVVLYDGHSYIGSGPMDPNNYSSSDFSSGYQIIFFNSCVSFNYYGVPYFKLKPGGTKNLDLVTNGLEVHIYDGGKSMGQFIAALFDGKQNTWLRMLEKTQVSSWMGVHDPNRSVDGEQDNTYDPTTTPITVVEAGSAVKLSVQNTSAACGQTASGTTQLAATATGAVRVDFLVGGNKVASASTAPYGAPWDSKTVADGTVQVTAKAFDAAGASVEATCSVQVSNGGGGGDLFVDDMESATTASNWTGTGLWHLAKNGTCASPAYASAVAAWYFGQDSTCNYKQSSAAKGTLTSRAIAGITAASKLSFKHYREVESTPSGSYDKTSVEVALDGTSTWKKLWSKDSKNASTKAWAAEDLGLAEYAGKTIKVRFNFDSVDSYDNEHVGWLIDDVRVTK